MTAAEMRIILQCFLDNCTDYYKMYINQCYYYSPSHLCITCFTAAVRVVQPAETHMYVGFVYNWCTMTIGTNSCDTCQLTKLVFWVRG